MPDFGTHRRDLPPQHCGLVAEHQDLHVLSGVAGRQEASQPSADYEQVDESDEHERQA